jgi:Zn-dependent peptidase ImmA (M78 family)
MWRLRDLPREIIVGENVWDLVFCKRIDVDPTAVGVCNNTTKEIVIVSSLSKEEKAVTLIHELLHAIEYEYGIYIPHSLIYKLEEPIYRLILDNLVFKK